MTTLEANPSPAPAQPPTAPHIVTELPGPKGRALIERDQAVASPSLTRAYPLVAESGAGCVVTDVDGNRFLDFAAGIAVCSTGHSHPKVVAAIKEQADRMIHIAATTFGCEWPVEQTAMPAAKSRNRLPSTSVTTHPTPVSATRA